MVEHKYVINLFDRKQIWWRKDVAKIVTCKAGLLRGLNKLICKIYVTGSFA